MDHRSLVVRAVAALCLLASLGGVTAFADASQSQAGTVVTVDEAVDVPADADVTAYADLAANERRAFDRLVAEGSAYADTLPSGLVGGPSYVEKGDTVYDVEMGVVDSGPPVETVLAPASAVAAVWSGWVVVAGTTRIETWQGWLSFTALSLAAMVGAGEFLL